MDAIEFRNMVKNMRDSQIAYFKNRSTTDLQNVKFWEKQVDKELGYINEQTTLF